MKAAMALTVVSSPITVTTTVLVSFLLQENDGMIGSIRF